MAEKKVNVTRAQSRAASALVQRSAVTGRYVRPGVAKIAEASPTYRSAVTGKLVSNTTTTKHPKTKHPKTTVSDKKK